MWTEKQVSGNMGNITIKEAKEDRLSLIVELGFSKLLTTVLVICEDIMQHNITANSSQVDIRHKPAGVCSTLVIHRPTYMD